jgi:alkylated DNA repair dioxygenase AlkB
MLQIKDIPGLYIIPNVFTKEENDRFKEICKSVIGKNICEQIHTATEYGWKFIPVKEKTIDDYLGPMPKWIDEIWEKAKESVKDVIDPKKYNHVLINNYIPGDGCKSHTDEIEFWEDYVIGVSFGSGCSFEYSKADKKIIVYMPECSVYLMINDARYKWRHGITFDKEDYYYGDLIERNERISLTFRSISEKFLTKEVKSLV